MITTTLSSDKSRAFGFYKDTLRRLKSFILFYGAVGFVFFPLQYLMSILRDSRPYFMGMGQVFNTVSLVFYGPFLCVIPVIVAAQIFGYMHSKKAVDLYHALPIRREEMLLSSFAAGMTAILAPLALNYAVVILLKAVRFGGGEEVVQVFINFLYVAVVSFAALAIATFVFTQVGTKFDAIVITLGLYVILPALYLLTLVFMSEQLYGFNVDQSVNWNLLLGLSPQLLFYYIYGGEQALGRGEGVPTLATGNLTAIAWLVISVLLLVAAAAIYRRRKSEMAENTSTGGILKIFIKIAATYLASVLMGFIFQGVFGVGSDDFSMFLLGVALGAVLFYLTAEIVLSRSFKAVFKSLPMAGGLAAVLCLFAFLMHQGGFGYVAHIPKVEDVASVTVNYRGTYGDSEREGKTGDYVGVVTLEGDEAKALMVELHRISVEEYQKYHGEVPDDSRYYRGYSYINLDYKLKSGGTMSRSYSSKSDAFLQCLAKLEANGEFIQKTHPVFRTNYQDLRQVTLTGASGVGIVPLTLNEEEMNQLFTCMQEDLLGRTYEQLTSGKPAIGFIDISYNFADRYSGLSRYGRYNPNSFAYDSSSSGYHGNLLAGYPEENFFLDGRLTLTEDFQKTVSFLREKGYGDLLELKAGDVTGLVFRHPSYDGYNSEVISQVSNYNFHVYNTSSQNWKEEHGYVVYRDDPAVIAEILPKLHSSVINGYQCIRVDYVVDESQSGNPAMEFPGGSVSTQSSYGYLLLEDLPEDVRDELALIDPDFLYNTQDGHSPVWAETAYNATYSYAGNDVQIVEKSTEAVAQ